MLQGWGLLTAGILCDDPLVVLSINVSVGTGNFTCLHVLKSTYNVVKTNIPRFFAKTHPTPVVDIVIYQLLVDIHQLIISLTSCRLASNITTIDYRASTHAVE